MSGGKGGGLLNRLVISPLIGLTIFFTCCYFVLGPSATASFAKTTTSALGYAAGVTLGSLPNLFDNMKSGQAATGGSSSASGTPNQQADRQRSADRQAGAQQERRTESRNATGNQRNDGTD